MSDLGLLMRQVVYTNRTFWRNPASAFFTFVFPLLFLVIFTTLLGNEEVDTGTAVIKTSTYYVAAQGAFGLISACFTNVALQIVFARDGGVLKRMRGTPLPPWVFLSARVIHATVIGLILVAITVAFGAVFYDASVPTGVALGQFVATLLVGAACFSALGLAVSGVIPNADAGPPIVNAVILPLLFLSGVFIPFGVDTPRWVVVVGDIFPVRHLVDAMRESYLGLTESFAWSDLGVMAIWAVVGVAVASRTFRWEPSR
ncbi:MAG: putative multidrug transporter permease protein [Actinomycetia bacterium]|nr:putative multidrug transporter permease protein [Actinomycetes bacterium]